MGQLQNQTNKAEQLLANIAREGRALLQGLILCGGCGRRLSPRYKGNGGIYPTYECTARHQDTIRLKDCISIQANLVDQAVSRRVLELLQPEQFQIALRAMNELQQRSEAIERQWRMRIERLDYQAQLAQRRYEDVDPSHRLVAATLEQRWNQALEDASYIMPAAVSSLTDTSGYEMFASFLLPFGIFLTGLAAFSLTASIWGEWPGLLATVAVVLLPDAYQQGFGNKFDRWQNLGVKVQNRTMPWNKTLKKRVAKFNSDSRPILLQSRES